MSDNTVRIRIPNAPGTGPILNKDDLRAARTERPPMITNRHYILDKDRWQHVPLTPDGKPVFGVIESAWLEPDSILLTLIVGDDEIAELMRAHGDPATGYVAVMVGMNSLRIAEVGLAPPLEPPAAVGELAEGARLRPGDQPLPVTADPLAPGMHDQAIELFQDRRVLGLTRYHATLQAFNGRDALQDAIEESADQLVYLLQVREEQKALYAVLDAALPAGWGWQWTLPEAVAELVRQRDDMARRCLVAE